MKENYRVPECPECGAPIPSEAPGGFCPRCLLAGADLETEPLSSPARIRPALTLDAIGAAFPDLDILEPIGSGGMGSVFKVRQKRLDRLVALKLLRCSEEHEEAFTRRFLREARALAKLNHPNIVTIYEFGESQGYYYLLMEFVDGVNLSQAMADGNLLPEEALEIVPKICDALQYAHEQGVLHRDIKPANILLDRQGNVKVADFGLAKFVHDRGEDFDLTRTEASLGTPAYMAPEQLERPGSVDHRADIYSLGVVFYEMLTGELPLGRYSPPSGKSNLGTGIDEVVMRTLEREPDARYQSAGEVSDDVSRFAESPREEPDPGTRSRDQSTSRPGQSPRVLGRAQWKRMVGAVLVLLSFPHFVFLVCEMATSPIGRESSETGRVLHKLFVLSLTCVAGLVGTLSGWADLRAIREASARGVDLAVSLFASVTWPIVLIAFATAAVIEKLAGRYLTRGTIVSLTMLVAAVVGITMICRMRRWALDRQPSDRGSRRRWWWASGTAALLCAVIVMRGSSGTLGSRGSKLVSAAESLDARSVIRLLKGGTFVDERSDTGDTALMWLARRGDVRTIPFLLQSGADVNAKNARGQTPLTLACSEGHTGVVAALLNAGASLDVRLPDGASALHLAAHAGHTGVVTLLLEQGMASDVRNRDEQTPLMLAADRSHLETAGLLVAAHASVEARDVAGKTAFMMAAAGGSVPLMDLLLMSGARIGDTDAQGRSALAYAVASGHPSATEWLIDHGAIVTPNWYLKNAFDAAASGEWEEAAAHLQDAQRTSGRKPLIFRREGWTYSCDHPGFAIPALLAEAAMRAGETALAERADQRSLEGCPQGLDAGDNLVVIQRTRDEGGVTNTERLSLSAGNIHTPIRSANGDILVRLEIDRNGENTFDYSGTTKSLFR